MGRYLPFTKEELVFIETQVIEQNFAPKYLMATEIAYEIKCRYGNDCSPQKVNKALHQCFGDTTLSASWEIPCLVSSILYQKHNAVYKWHKVLVPVINDQIFGDQNPYLLQQAIAEISLSSMN